MTYRALTLALALFLLPLAARADLTPVPTWRTNISGAGTRTGLAYDAAGNLFVTAGGSHEIIVYPGSGETSFTIYLGSLATGYPNQVAVNAGTGRLYTNVNSGGTLAVYTYNAATGDYSRNALLNVFSNLGNFKNLDQFCFSPDGGLLFASFSNGTTGTAASIVRVATRGTGDTWTDTGQILAPGGATLTTAELDPRNNQGICQGLAADAAGNLWVGSYAEPGSRNGSTFVENATAYVRPLRFYARQPDNTFLLAAEIPLTQRVTGIALSPDGTLYAAEGRSVNGAGVDTSYRIHAWRGLQWVGSIDTGVDSLWNLVALAVAPDGSLAAAGHAALSGSTRAVQRWSVSGIPSLVTHTVQGTVTQLDTGQPVPGARVHLLNQWVTADAAGHYTASVPATGDGAAAPGLIVRADAPGHAGTRRRSVRVPAATTLDIGLARKTPAAGTGYFAETTLGAVESGAGLLRLDALASDSSVVSVGSGTDNGRRVTDGSALDYHVTGNSIEETGLSFDVDPAFAGSSALQPVFVTARWLDEEAGSADAWRLQYNPTAAEVFTSSAGVKNLHGDGVRDASIYLSQARLINSGLTGADFRLLLQGDVSITFQNVAVTKAPPPLLNATPNGFAAPVYASPSHMVHPPTIYNGAIYVSGYVNRLYALDAATGARLSTFPSAGYALVPGRPVGRPVVFRTPDGKAHVCVALRNGTFVVLDAVTGAEEWRWIGDSGVTCASAPVVYVDSSTGTPTPIVIAGLTHTDTATNTSTGRVERYRLRADGTVTADFRLDVGTAISSAPAMSAGMGEIFIGFTDGPDGHLLILKNPSIASGDQAFVPLRDFTAPGEPIKAPPVLFGDGRTMLLGSSNGTTGHLYAANSANAGVLWSTAMGGVETSPWVDYLANGPRQADTVYLGTTDGWIHSLNLTDGTERAGWPVRPVPGATGGSLLALGNKVYVGCALGMLVLNAADPLDYRLFSPAYDAAAAASGAVAIEAPSFNEGASASGSVPGQSIIAMTGSDGRLYAMSVQ